jgi:hypothetical protein
MLHDARREQDQTLPGQRRSRDHGLPVTLVDRAGLHHEIDELDPDDVRQRITLGRDEGAYMVQAGMPPLVTSPAATTHAAALCHQRFS